MKVALIGDSHSEATFPMIKEKLLAKGHEVVFQLSKRGWATYSFFDKDLLPQLRLAKPDAVIVALGGNNHRTNPEQYQSIVSDFLSRIGYPQVKVVWVGPYTSDPIKAASTAERHDWTANFLRTQLPSNVTFIDTRPISLEGFEPDGVHFKYTMYQKMVDLMEKDLLAGLQKGWLVPVKKFAPVGLVISALGMLSYFLYRRYKR